MFNIKTYFDISNFEHKKLFDKAIMVWDPLKILKEYIKENLKPAKKGNISEHAVIEDNVYIGENTVIDPNVYIKGPTIIGDNCEIRHGAFIRGNCVVGDNCIVGHDSEMKGSILLDGAKVPHFAYVGDSILGNKSNLGAGTKISNFKITQDTVNVVSPAGKVNTGLRKFGAIIGDNVQTGCNTVLNPGTLIGKNTLIYALSSLKGVIPPDSILKLKQEQTIIEMIKRD